MEHDYTIAEFVTLVRNKRVRATTSPEQVVNLFRWLKSQGFAQTELDGRTIYLQRIGGAVKPSSIIAMRYAFLEFLENYQFKDWPESITRHDLIEWFYKTRPPKQNHAFNDFLYSDLSGEERHQYLMAHDSHYRHRFNIDAMLQNLEALGFQKTIDRLSGFSKEADLYYKKVAPEQYLVFNHYNKDLKSDRDGFDCWIAPFKSESHIGMVPCPNARGICLGFQYDRDMPLIARYLQ